MISRFAGKNARCVELNSRYGNFMPHQITDVADSCREAFDEDACDEYSLLLGHEYDVNEYAEVVDLTDEPVYLTIAATEDEQGVLQGEHGFVCGMTGKGKTHLLKKVAKAITRRPNPHILAIYGDKKGMDLEWASLTGEIGGHYMDFSGGDKRFWLGDIPPRGDGLLTLRMIAGGTDTISKQEWMLFLEYLAQNNHNLIATLQFLAKKLEYEPEKCQFWERVLVRSITESKYLTLDREEAFRIRDPGAYIFDFHSITEDNVKDAIIYFITKQIQDWAVLSSHNQGFILIDEYSSIISSMSSMGMEKKHVATGFILKQIADAGRQQGMSLWTFMQSRKDKGKFAKIFGQITHVIFFQVNEEYERKKLSDMTDGNIGMDEMESFFGILGVGSSFVGRCFYYDSSAGNVYRLQIPK